MSSTLAWGIALAVATVFATPSAQAVCYGSSNMYTCSDSSGNSYNVNRFGTTTTVNGYNAQNWLVLEPNFPALRQHNLHARPSREWQ